LGVASTVEAGDDLKTSLVAVLKLEQELDFLNLNGLIGEECTNEAGGFDEEAGKEILESNDFYKKTLEESPERPFEAEILAPCKVCNAAGQALCWHKVNDGFHFLFQLAVSPNPASATWIAVGTAFGCVQLICVDCFYHPDMDVVLGREPTDPVPHGLFNPKPLPTKKPRTVRRGRPRVRTKLPTPSSDTDSTLPCRQEDSDNQEPSSAADVPLDELDG
uniref:CW-type domain-containing protein n=1 Tax=Schistocephalus solidus TaxID=70667 RepID=A0A183TGZ4_SCHSO